MPADPVKTPKTFNEQMAILRNKGIVIDDEDACLNFLRHVNYYRLSAYFLPFLGSNGKFLYPVNFSSICRIYEFDGHLRRLLFRCIEKIEISLRAQLAYFSAHKHGALGYLDAKNFSPRHDKVKFNSLITRCIEENKHSLVVKHHKERYGGNFPIWVMIEFFSVGMLSYFYADLIESEQKTIARNLYHTTSANLRSWLRCLTDLRNRCAHYARIYYWNFSALPRIPKGTPFLPDRLLLTQLLALKSLYPDHSEWNIFVIDIAVLINEYEGCISLANLGFINDWQKLLRY